MALELFVGAGLGVVFEQFRKEIWRVKENVGMFKSRFEGLEKTLEVLSPVILEILELNRRLNNGSDHGTESTELRKLLTDGMKLVSECSNKPRWDVLKLKRFRLGEKLLELHIRILSFHNIYMQAQMARDVKQTLLVVQETKQMMIMSLNRQQGDSSNLTMELTASSSIDSSDLTMSLTASSTDPVHKMQLRIVFKMAIHCDSCRGKALRIATFYKGFSSAVIEGDDKNKLVMIGHGLDPVRIVKHLRKKVGHAELISVSESSPLRENVI